MADGNRDSRRRFGRRGRGKPGVKDAERPADKPREAELPAFQAQAPDQPPPVCSICGKPIFDLSSAIAGRDEGAPVHFDCALAQAASGERLEADEKVAYVGRGSFAVIKFKDKSQTTFAIERRIQWEKEGSKPDWRKSIQQRMGV